MFGFGQQKNDIKDQVANFDINKLDFSKFQKQLPRYEYDVKVFDTGDDDRPIVTIQKGIKANSDAELAGIYALSDQKIQILNKKEINPPKNNPVQQQVVQQPIGQQVSIPEVKKPVEPKYFSAGGLDFKLVGDDMFQKQWVRATEEECRTIRIINDANNKIVELKGKHLEVQRWIKVESSEND